MILLSRSGTQRCRRFGIARWVMMSGLVWAQAAAASAPAVWHRYPVAISGGDLLYDATSFKRSDSTVTVRELLLLDAPGPHQEKSVVTDVRYHCAEQSVDVLSELHYDASQRVLGSTAPREFELPSGSTGAQILMLLCGPAFAPSADDTKVLDPLPIASALPSLSPQRAPPPLTVDAVPPTAVREAPLREQAFTRVMEKLRQFDAITPGGDTLRLTLTGGSFWVTNLQKGGQTSGKFHIDEQNALLCLTDVVKPTFLSMQTCYLAIPLEANRIDLRSVSSRYHLLVSIDN